MTSDTEHSPILTRLLDACAAVAAPSYVIDLICFAFPEALDDVDAATLATLGSPGWKAFEAALVEACHDVHDQQWQLVGAVILVAIRSGELLRMRLARDLRGMLLLDLADLVVLRGTHHCSSRSRAEQALGRPGLEPMNLRHTERVESLGLLAGDDLTAMGHALVTALLEV